MKPGGYIKRRTRLKARRDRKRRVSPDRVRSEEHKAKVRALPCVVGSLHRNCEGDNQASHEDKGKGIGLKTSDLTCVSMCAKHHREWTDHNGWCDGWSRELRRAWFALATAATLQRLEYEASRPRTFAEDLHW